MRYDRCRYFPDKRVRLRLVEKLVQGLKLRRDLEDLREITLREVLCVIYRFVDFVSSLLHTS
jgi:hypothetical protein